MIQVSTSGVAVTIQAETVNAHRSQIADKSGTIRGILTGYGEQSVCGKFAPRIVSATLLAVLCAGCTITTPGGWVMQSDTKALSLYCGTGAALAGASPAAVFMITAPQAAADIGVMTFKTARELISTGTKTVTGS